MIVYFDTSALLALVVEEPGSERAARVWRDADRRLSVRLLYAEARAALAQASRQGRIEPPLRSGARRVLDRLYASIDRIEIDEALVRRAGDLADGHGLRGYDAVHLAAVLRIADAETVLATGDTALLQAAQHEGLAVAATSR